MAEPSILIVHRDRKAQRIVQRVLGATGMPVEVADDLAQGMRMLALRAPVLVVVDGQLALTASAPEFFAAAHAHGAEACMTLLGGGSPTQLPAILDLGAVTNLLVHPMPVLAEELTITAHKLLRNDLFGAEKYLLWGTELRALTMTRASQRPGIVAQLAEQVRAIGQSPRVASMAMLVTDELLSNAVHNAPIDGSGAHYRADLARDTEIELDDRHRVDLRWGCDARYLAIEVTDHFGSLDRDMILRALAKHDVREQGGGAGMGLALTYRSCDHLVFNLAPANRTQIIAMIDVRPHVTSGPPGSHAERAHVSSYNVFVERRQEGKG